MHFNKHNVHMYIAHVHNIKESDIFVSLYFKINVDRKSQKPRKLKSILK